MTEFLVHLLRFQFVIDVVPPLENFVMNRVLGDYFENLLYNVFVSINERTTVEQLAGVLQTDVENVKVVCNCVGSLTFPIASCRTVY